MLPFGPYPLGVARGAPPLACDDATAWEADGCAYLADYTPGQCLWAPRVPLRTCGRPRQPASSYCPSCHIATHRPPTEAERDVIAPVGRR